MADDVTFTAAADATPPAGTKAATDDINVAGAHFGSHAGVAKLAVSADGDGTHIPADVANGLDVDVTRVSGNVAVTSASASQVDGHSATIGAIADADTANTVIGRLKKLVSLLGGGLPAALVGGRLDVNIGAAGATVGVDSELTTADLDTGVGTDTRAVVGLVGAQSGGGQLIDGTAANGLEVDVTRLPSLVAGTANIGDVDVLTVPAPLSTTGGGLEATALRVTVATDSTGVLSVDDNGGSLTVDGPLTDTQLRATPVPVSGTVTANVGTGTQPVSGSVSISGAVDTELPAAAALADNSANPTVPGVGGFSHLFDGTTWDRARAADALSTTPVSKAGVTATGIGPGWDYKLAAGTLGTAIGSTLENDVDGAEFFIYRVATDTTGTYTFEVTADDTNWTVTNVWQIDDPTSKLMQPGGGKLPVLGDTYAVATGLWRKVRVRTTATLGVIVTFHRTGVIGGVIDILENAFKVGTPGLVVTQLTASDLNAEVQGRLTADAAIVTSRPLLAGGRASAAIPTAVSADGDAVMGWFGPQGQLKVTLVSPTGLDLNDAGNGVKVIQAQPPWEVVGDGPADLAVPANPLTIGGRASTAVPTAVSADADSVHHWTDRLGRQLVQSGVPIGTEVTKTAQYTTAQTGTALWTPAAGKKVVVIYVQIGAAGTTAGTMQLWFGAAADTTYTRGTDRAIFDHEFAPSATLKPGFSQTKESGWAAAAADDVLRVTTSAAMTVTISVWGYEI